MWTTMESTPDAMVLRMCKISKVRKIGGAEHDLLSHLLFFLFFFCFLFVFCLIIFIILTVQEFACSQSYGINKTTKTKRSKQSKKQYPYPSLLP